MGAVPGSLCWKKQWQHFEGMRGHCHTHWELHPPQKMPKKPRWSLWVLLPCPGERRKQATTLPLAHSLPTSLIPSLGIKFPNSLFGTIPEPLRPPQA